MDVSAALRDCSGRVASERDDVDAACAAARGVEDVRDIVSDVYVVMSTFRDAGQVLSQQLRPTRSSSLSH
jgi:hypothetical protein